MPPQLIFGTATFGMDMTAFQDASSVHALLTNISELGIHRLDTGAHYPPMKPRRAEELIGETKELSVKFVVDTKVYTDTQKDGSGDLTGGAIERSVRASLGRLGRDEVNVLYGHRADPQTALEEQIQGFNAQIQQGRCKAWGVSNVPPGILEEMLHLCEQNGYKKPSCYQGDSNLVTRSMETKILPLLREHDSKPTRTPKTPRSGFLIGALVNNEQAGTRSANDTPLGKHRQKLFGAEDLHAAMRNFDAGVKAQGLTLIEVATRWMAHQSTLGDNNGIILGASRSEQVIGTVEMIGKGPLPGKVLRVAEELWDLVKGTRGEII